jgi:hypothetical protein
MCVTANFDCFIHQGKMRGADRQQAAMFSYVTLEQRIAVDHPVRRIRALVYRSLKRMDADFAKLYSFTGRPSIAPEQLLRSMLLMVLYSIRSERQLMEQMEEGKIGRDSIHATTPEPCKGATCNAIAPLLRKQSRLLWSV